MFGSEKKSALTVEAIAPGYTVAASPVRHRHVAVVVIHGMGQQVPYETLATVAEAIVREGSGKRGGPKPANMTVDLVQLVDGYPPLAQAAFTLKHNGDDGERIVDVHVYEAYWAPLTAGVASVVDALTFLAVGAFNGLWSRLRSLSFKRWMFGGFQELPIKHGTALSILAALGGLAVVLAPAAYFVQHWALVSKASGTLPVWRLLLANGWLSALSLVLAGAYTLALRYVITEYVGDVAVYVTAHKVSRFEETRTKIQAAVGQVLRQVYEARDPKKALQYDAVVIAGHSLGSVIAYDTLNAAIAWDRDEKGRGLRVAERTRRLITFGSPLDKTAYLFRTQVNNELRETIAALKQPLILDYSDFRPKPSFKWVNIYSRADVISGPLAYYDVPVNAGAPLPPWYNPVENLVDTRAWIPFLAHVQYWGNRRLHEQLLEAVLA